MVHVSRAEDDRRWAMLTIVAYVLEVVEATLQLRERRRDRGRSERDDRWGRALEQELARLAPCVGAARLPEVIVTRAVANAGASGGRIYLNPQWMEAAAQQLCAREGECRRDLVRGLAAHELSHHVRGAGRAGRDAHTEELTADAWAGFLLARTGAGLKPYVALIGGGAVGGSVTHPPTHLRIAAAQAGGRAGEAERVAGGCCDGCQERSL